MFPLLYVPVVEGSTNDEVLKAAEKIDGHVALYTYRQLAGRGQYGNIWQSSRDENLAYSLALRPEGYALSARLFNFYTALVVRDFVANLTASVVKVKWPNDILVSGKKISGMLVEQRRVNGVTYWVSGVGINVKQKHFEGLPKAGSILSQTGLAIDLDDFTQRFHAYYSEALVRVPGEAEVLSRFNEWLFRRDEVSFFALGGIRQNGIIRKVDEEGALHVELEKDGLRCFRTKEIELLY
ncbi:biotin--[acetyl-CoA-carboxylase] ligase [Bergeyella sp. RCAD1439]|uniref:biotin--[acetyl-CoA-carboxylase] ligase n=1 Tax=Bergeyella anatis TaxID=3113737 RepID=UPI002E1728BA|nr:biotin--[acetyl-CoA-carboxylase] ligase [Bergeyella sp. RCAD1439]